MKVDGVSPGIAAARFIFMTDEKIKCPGCGAEKIQKYGRTAAGVQKYRCMRLGCRRQFGPGSDHLIDPAVRIMVMRLINERIEPSKIHNIVNGLGPEKISLRWIQELKRRKLN